MPPKMQACQVSRSLLFPLIVLSSITAQRDGGNFLHCNCGAQAPGDIVIGLIWPLHHKVNNIHDRVRPDRFTCSFLDLESFMLSLGAIHEIEAINAARLLPGVHLGYMMCDTCSHASKALQSVEHMLSIRHALHHTVCSFTDFRPKVKVFLGGLHSEVAISVSTLLNVYMIPLISSASSSPKLSDKLRYPVFLRTVPSDTHQVQAVVKLMKHYGWNWVGVVFEDGEYGRSAFQSFQSDAADSNVCLAYQEMLTYNENPAHSLKYIKHVSQQIISSSAKVVVLILRAELVKSLFEEMIRTKTTRTWISTDAWSQSSLVSKMDGINMVGDILGLTFISHRSKSFDNYLTNLTVTPGGYNRFIEEYKNLRFNCTPECFSNRPPPYCPPPHLLKIKSPNACHLEDPQSQNDDYLVNSLDSNRALSTREAVWAVAYALQKLLKCNSSSCLGELNFPPWKLFKELKEVKFIVDNKTLFFDQNGDFVSGYDVIEWKVDGNHRRYQKIGRYSMFDKEIKFSVNVTWISTGSTTFPQSRCSENCPPGSIKKILNVSCCYKCTLCHDGTYSDKWDLDDCKNCPNGTWSLQGWDHCEPRWESYLKWSDPYPITLTTAAAFGILLLIAILIIFLVHRDSPPMKRAEVRLSCVMMVGLAVSFASVICFMGKPTVYLCCARQVMYAMGFTLCVSCILVKAFRFFLAFLPFGRMTNRRLHKLYNPPVIITIIMALQVIICLLWMIFDSPYVEGSPPSPKSMKKIIQCREGATYFGYGIMLGYIGLLAFIGFLLAFKGRKVPQEFSETGYIIFSMLMYLFVWVCFIPVYITNSEEGTAVQASAILVSTYGIIFCHFLPKCYEALRKLKTVAGETVLERNFSLTSELTIDTFTICSQRTERLSVCSTTTILRSSGYVSEDNATDSEVIQTPEPQKYFNSPFFNKEGTKLKKRCRSISL